MRRRWSLKKLLSRLDLASNEVAQEEFPYRFYVSDLAEKFKDFANSILPYNVEKHRRSISKNIKQICTINDRRKECRKKF